MNEYCDPILSCVWSTVRCNDNNDCTNDLCDTHSGCSYETIPNCQITAEEAEEETQKVIDKNILNSNSLTNVSMVGIGVGVGVIGLIIVIIVIVLVKRKMHTVSVEKEDNSYINLVN